MCGIVGVKGFNDRSLVKRMADLLHHRGPDDEGYYSDKGVELGNKRLSIIDLETGRQPIRNEDSSIWMVYNGEVYNFQDLRRVLTEKRHKFYTKSDTEVLLHQYEEDGYACVEKFDGMFTFALWDSNRKTLFLARDRYGIKPLYYTWIDDSLLFASEIKAFLACDSFTPKLDLKGCLDQLGLRYVPGEKTIFEGVFKLKPSHCMALGEDGEAEVWRYWRPVFSSMDMSEDEAVSHLRLLLERSVASHLVADVEVGVYLSGGVDSSFVAAVASRRMKGLKSFCMGFGEEGDELDDARRMAEWLGTDHYEVVVDDLISDFPQMIWYADSPKRNLWPHHLAALASRYVKVVLSGLGGDEIFAGYEWRYKEMLSSELHDPSEKVTKYLSTHGRDLYEVQENVLGEKLSNVASDVFETFYPSFSDRKHVLDQTFNADFENKLMHDFLHVDDATSMAHSLESRVPYLENNLVGFALKIPWSLKFKDGRGKYLFKRAIADALPRFALEKEKTGFNPDPLEVWRKGLKERCLHYLGPDARVVRDGLIDIEGVGRLMKSTDISRSLVNRLWHLLGLELWYRIFISREMKPYQRI